MIESFNNDMALKFKTLSPEEKKSRGILGRLYGPVATFKAPTRNQRKYPQELWENLFESPLIKERFKSGGIFGELTHPDRSEVDMEKIAIVMPNPPVKDKDGQLVGYVDIVDTPCGKIAYQLAKYGYKFGISSRGEGDLITDNDGNESVDPDTYTLSAFDLVEIPAVENARLTFTESLNTKKSLKESLNKVLSKASEEEKKIMNEAIEDLGIDLDDAEEVGTTQTGGDTYIIFRKVVDGRGTWFAKKGDDGEAFEITYAQATGEEPINAPKNEDLEKSEEECIDNTECTHGNATDKEDAEEVVDDESKELVAELQEALQKIKSLEAINDSLKEQLSVCNAKESEVSAQLNRYKSATVALSDSTKSLKSNVKDLTESLSSKDEEIAVKERRIRKLVDSTKKLKESIKPDRSEEVEHLTKELDNSKKQLADSQLLVTKYKASYSALKENYLAVQAKIYGVPKEDVRKNLSESYKIKDIDKACADLASKKRKLDSLPFALDESVHIEVKKSSNEYIASNMQDNVDDSISDTLRYMADM